MNKQQLFENIRKKQSFLCVGLDTDIKKIPAHLLSGENLIFAFNKAIIDATADFCVAYKPNMAFYESLGVDGIRAFEETVAYLRKNYPDQFIIADAKRGDIGNTSEMYARSFFDHIKVDAVTVAPYMGEDSVKPFLLYPEAWVILLALTSNKGSHDFQLTEDKEGERLFEKVLRKSQEWASDEQMMYVVGATQGKMFVDIRKCVPNHFLLVPGEFSRIKLEGFIAKDTITIPQAALLQDAQGSYVYKIVDGKATQAKVVLGHSVGNTFLIQSGLQEGDVIITNQLVKLRPGTPVNPINNQANQAQ